MPTFLNPGLLWGLSLASIPILIHIFNRRRFRRMEWAAMTFLLAAMKKHQRRLRIENLLLLLIRTALLLLLAFAIARPLFASAGALGALQRERTSLVIVLDNSYSMDVSIVGADSAFRRGVDEAKKLIGGLDPEDTVSVVVTSDNFLRQDLAPRAIVSRTADHDKARTELDRLEVSTAPARLVPALRAAEAELDVPGTHRRVVVVTDLQAAFWGGFATPASDGDSDATGVTGVVGPTRNEETETVRDFVERFDAAGIPFAVVDVGASGARNVGIGTIRPAYRQNAVIGTPSAWLVDVWNFGPTPVSIDLTLFLDGRKYDSREVTDVPGAAGPGRPGIHTERFRLEFPSPGEHAIEARIGTRDATNDLGIDDVRTHAVEVWNRMRILAVDGDPNPDEGRRPETFLLKNALQLRDSGPIQVDVVDALGLPRAPLDDYDLVILANVDRLREETVRRLETFVRGGASLVIFLGDRVDLGQMNELMLATDDGLLPARLGREVLRGRTDPARLDLSPNDHRMLRDLTGASDTDWLRSPPIYGFVSATPAGTEATPSEVLLRLDDVDRSPALFEKRFGEGRVLLFTTAADDDWADFGSAPFYVALLHDMVHALTWADPARRNRMVGDSVEMVLPKKAGAVTVLLPEGGTVRLDPIVEDDRAVAVLRNTTAPGIYRISYKERADEIIDGGEDRERSELASFGLDPVEGDLTRLDHSALRARFPSVVIEVTSDANTVFKARTEVRQGEIWRSLLIAVVALLALETFLARRFGDYKRRGAVAGAEA